MLWLARGAVGLAGLFSMALGLNALFAPEALADALGIAAVSDLGRSAVRADLGAFFLASAIACAGALFAARPSWLYGAALLYGLALTGRVLDIVLAGAPEGVGVPIFIESVMVAALLFGARTLADSSPAAR